MSAGLIAMWKDSRIPCIRCLLREMNEAKAYRQVQEYQSSVPEKERAVKEQYESRLAICKECKWLNQGTCRKCGAYVEARAYRKDAHCPLGEKMW